MHTGIHLLVRVLVFGAALGIAMRHKGVTIQPRWALPLVALVFAVLNAFLYPLIKIGINVVTLWTLFLIVPFLVNAALLLLTDKVLRPFKIESMTALLYASAAVTLAHLVLRLAGV